MNDFGYVATEGVSVGWNVALCTLDGCKFGT
jgi:hypothetical protein